MRFPLDATALVTALVAMLTASAPVHAAVPDLAREDRWAAQVAPQVVVGDVVWLSTKLRPRVLAIYTKPSGAAKGAVIVVHGLGVNPDWELIGVLRTALADRGFATLSVQMPVLAADAPAADYVDLYPDAGARLSAALAWLHERGYARIAVVSHSLGAAMTDAWLAHGGGRANAGAGAQAGAIAGAGGQGIVAWVPVGMAVPFSMRPGMPVLDVVAEQDFTEVLATEPTRAAELPHDGCSRAVTVPGTNHFYEGAEARLVDVIVPFLGDVFDGRCGAGGGRSDRPQR
ncbi:MAG: DUF3530 family protein [Casimicrobiaceae bacterium]